MFAFVAHVAQFAHWIRGRVAHLIESVGSNQEVSLPGLISPKPSHHHLVGLVSV